MKRDTEKIYDIFVVGGGINGLGVARDAAGRGYSICLCEMNDFASGTSSNSTKLIHGGLRYLEYYKFRLVQESLKEREVLLKMAPHIIWPMRFILPHSKGMRPAWLLRLGLALYDHLGFRKILSGTSSVNLHTGELESTLKNEYKFGYEYSDCWVDDSRLVILNAVDAAKNGAKLQNYTKVTKVTKSDGLWLVTTTDSIDGSQNTIKAKCFINASGPWVDDVLQDSFSDKSSKNVRLVRGSHIVVNKLYDHDKSFICQNDDGRIFFMIPYEDKFTLIGTTDIDHGQSASEVEISEEEKQYICDSANTYLNAEIKLTDIVWCFSGVRPLYEDGASKAQEATRDYVIKAEEHDSLLMINIFGGKITTYRRLSEAILKHIETFLGQRGNPWTDKSSLPGGNFAIDGKFDLNNKIQEKYSFLNEEIVKRLVRSYGTVSFDILGNAKNIESLGENFGSGLYEKEVIYLIQNEWARSSEDILFRRSKLGLSLTKNEKNKLDKFLENYYKLNNVSESSIKTDNIVGSV
jgi:glycerol-3-phosphate dehydrogenase